MITRLTLCLALCRHSIPNQNVLPQKTWRIAHAPYDTSYYNSSENNSMHSISCISSHGNRYVHICHITSLQTTSSSHEERRQIVTAPSVRCMCCVGSSMVATSQQLISSHLFSSLLSSSQPLNSLTCHSISFLISNY